MGNMRFKVGDEVRIKGTDIEGTVESIIRGQLIVNYKGSKIPAWPEDIVLMESVEEDVDLIPKFGEFSDDEPLDVPKMTTDFIKEIGGLPCPEGYIFKDENGNVINATKIVLEKKKKEYPKTYEECCKVMGYDDRETYCVCHTYANERLFESLYRLKVCRDAYWKIAGEEMGLRKPWEPDWGNVDQNKHCIRVDVGDIILNEGYRCQHILAFPTAEMRDAFKENFDPDIEFCKELL